MIIIEDDIHGEHHGTFERFEEAIAELNRRAEIAWDQPPNLAPCMSWRTCGREYHITEYDDSQTPWKPVRSVAALNISAKGVDWVCGFEMRWRDESKSETKSS